MRQKLNMLNSDESDIFYKERKFVLDLVKYSYSTQTPG